MLDLAIKEVLCLTIVNLALHRVLKPGVVIQGYELPVGSFMCCPLGNCPHSARDLVRQPNVTKEFRSFALQ